MRRRDYVAGFLVSPDTDSVVLIEKRTPAWQAGKLNGVGGKIEAGETPAGAMRREFCEETGLDIDEWDLLLTLDWEGGIVHFFRKLAPIEVLAEVKTVEDEEVRIVSITNLLACNHPMIPNLRWLVPLAAYTHDRYAPFAVREVLQSTVLGEPDGGDPR